MQPVAAGGIACALLALCACASPGPSPQRLSAPVHGAAGLAAGDEAWEIPAGELGSQRLYRLHYAGPDGEGSLKVTLRLAAPDRYQVTVADTLGRSLWSLGVDGERGEWIDSRQQRWCSFDGPLGLAGIPLSPFPLPALPALLLGRLPVAPAGPVRRGPGELGFAAGEGRRLTASLAAGELEAWTLWQAGEPAVWWRRLGEESLLSARGKGGEAGVQMRWRQVLREPLSGPLPRLDPPPGFLHLCAPAPPAAGMEGLSRGSAPPQLG